MLNRKVLAVLLAGIAVSSMGIAYFAGAFNALAGNNHNTTTTTTTTAQPPSLSAEYTGSKQAKEPCNSYFSCGYVPYCYPGIPCEDNFTISNKGNQSVILSGYRFPDGQNGFLWQPLALGESFVLSLWDQAGYESSRITLTTSSGYTVTLGAMPPQSITVREGHGFQDIYHVSLALMVLSNSSIPSPVNFTSYSVQDPRGNIYSNAGLGYTTMPFPPFVNGYGPGVVRVSISYGPGFVQGSNYTLTLVTLAYGNFSFQVTGGMFQAIITYANSYLIVLDGVNATGPLLSTHFTTVNPSVSFYQLLVYDGNTVIGTYTCPSFPSSFCTFSGSSWITVTLSTIVDTTHVYWLAFSLSGDAPGYYVTF